MDRGTRHRRHGVRDPHRGRGADRASHAFARHGRGARRRPYYDAPAH